MMELNSYEGNEANEGILLFCLWEHLPVRRRLTGQMVLGDLNEILIHVWCQKSKSKGVGEPGSADRRRDLL